MAEIVAAVAGALSACFSFVAWKRDRRRDKRVQLQDQDLKAEEAFYNSAVFGKSTVERQYMHGVDAIGKSFAEGDGSYTLLKIDQCFG